MTTKIVFFFHYKKVLNKYLVMCVILIRKPIKNTNVMKKYICTVCEYIYDPEQREPESGIEPGTACEDIPDCLLYTSRIGGYRKIAP